MMYLNIGNAEGTDMGKVVAYYRVSTKDQDRSGLGIAAQKTAVANLCEARGWQVVHGYTETESGKRNDRPVLAKALHHAKVTGATLIIAKLDRLSRNAAFLLQLRDSGVRFIAADMPEACELTVGILALVAEQERKAISQRTKDALAAAKARAEANGVGIKADGTEWKTGARLGNPNGAAAFKGANADPVFAREAAKANANSRARDYAPIIADIQATGATSLREIAAELNSRGIVTPRGGQWHASSVRNLLARSPSL
jgi:DNA invertase Pin-like site-specific DNA recombinase